MELCLECYRFQLQIAQAFQNLIQTPRVELQRTKQLVQVAEFLFLHLTMVAEIGLGGRLIGA
ncbi:hypothetical protein Hanom_Chr03g00269671 [Helianthus anomalus]